MGQVIRNTVQDHDKFTYAVKNMEISRCFMKASHQLGSNFMEIWQKYKGYAAKLSLN